MEGKNPIQVAGRIFETLELLSENGPMGLMEISGHLHLNKSTAHRILNSLIYMGYAKQNENNNKYEPSLKVVDLANKVMSKVDIVNLVRPHLRRLMELTKETVHFVERDGMDAVYIDKVESYSNGIQMVSRIGSRIPLYCSGVGKSMVAQMPESEIREIWERSHIIRMTPNTITDYAAFQGNMEMIREKGYALDNEENEIGVRCVAASLKDHTGKVRYAFSISAPVNRMDPDRIQEIARCVLDTKKQMESELRP